VYKITQLVGYKDRAKVWCGRERVVQGWEDKELWRILLYLDKI